MDHWPVNRSGTELTLTEKVMVYVRDAVHSGAMPCDTWYSVYQLSEQLGVSRSPVRDALLRLEEAGLVRFTKNRGFQIVPTHPEDVAEIFALRLGIEAPAAFRAARLLAADAEALDAFRTATQTLLEDLDAAASADDTELFFRLDTELHRLIVLTGRSERGWRFVEQLRTHTRILGPSTAGTSRSLEDIRREHLPVIEAILAGDAPGARQAMAAHVENTGRLLLRQALRRAGHPDPDSAVPAIWNAYVCGFSAEG
ncbi:GntR family transcriptional regulator [Corynebacterium uropygiale]|uniref:GntR family transcriptional regulator n=1 Tax=Corynebacterium uropygiale TaxID=1775911 RepID=A0A9X1QPQ6_9CORY|nr:GntR family transcriptional regulator [Corynebacterium uropygiale]MCF4006167.1 GntR family transcriptional regulator [Corynebacterium uropygiale]